MEIFLEEIKKVNDFITVFDDDGLATIQMSEKSVKTIIDIFDNYINKNENHKEIIKVTEFNETFELSLTLTMEEDVFNLTGTVNDNNYNDFELEFCDIITWNKIKKLLD
jgi:hypothetical protein